jgi:hypothetical protein
MLEIIAVNRQSATAEEKKGREILRQNRHQNGDGQLQPAVATRKIANYGCEQHEQQTATNLGTAAIRGPFGLEPRSGRKGLAAVSALF